MRAFTVALVLALAPSARADSLNQRGVDRLNQDVQELWSHDGLPMIRTAALDELQKLVGVPHNVNSKTTATIVRVNSLTFDGPWAPGVRRLDQSGAEMALPLNGAWNLAGDVEVRIKGKLLFIPIDQTFAVRVALTQLTARIAASFDSSDPAAPKVRSISPPVVRFNLKITSSNVIVDALGWLSSGLVDTVGRRAVAVAAVWAAAKLQAMVADTPRVFNDGGAALPPVRRGPLELAAAKLGDEIESLRTPFGPILEMKFDAPYSGTWGDSLVDPAFSPGRAVGTHAFGDSGEMTGHYLAALAYQYAVTHSPSARDHARRALATLTTLLTMRGEPGNMNRSIMPISFLEEWQRPSTQYTPGNDWAQLWNGQLHSFTDYTSRDEYMGLFYGLTIARDLFDDAGMKAQAQAGIEMALDYILRNGWTWRRHDGAWGERWQGAFDQQYAWVLAAWSGNPAKYQAVHDQYHGFADLIWTGMWTSAIDPHGEYYKFQLGSGTIQVLLEHETDPAAYMRAYQAVAVQRHYIGHHLNAHFNNVYLAFDPSAVARLGAENTNLLSRWLLWPRRRPGVDLHGDASIEKMQYTAPLNAAASVGLAPKTKEIAKYPIAPDRRIGSGFMWSVSPCQLDPGFVSNPDLYIEGETLDFVLPYWMARYHRAIVPPTRPPRAPSDPALVDRQQ